MGKHLRPGADRLARSHRPDRRRTSRAGLARVAAIPLIAIAVLGACAGDDGADAGGDTATTAAAPDNTAAGTGTTAAGTATSALPQTGAGEGVTAEGISDERCGANRAAGKITYLSSFDFAAAASILDVVVAADKGYYERMCLDVELRPNFSTANYPLVAAGQAQFSSAGSYTEMLNFSRTGGEFVAVVNYGKTPVEALLVKEGSGITTLADLKGKTIGVKGDIPPSLVAMLNQAGLVRGKDYSEVLLDGFDPRAHFEQAIDALPVYKSNEPGQLDAAGVKYTMFDPTDEGIPGSFGILYTSKAFLQEHPTAVEDFVRASLKGFEDAVDDPAGAVAMSLKRIEAAGNQAFLTQAGEEYRWTQEAAIVQASTPAGKHPGLIDPFSLMDEVDAYAAADVFGDDVPSTDGTFAEDIALRVVGTDGKVIWPAG